MRSIDQWLEGYAADHRSPTNIAIHWVCVPLILWSVIALLWIVPVPEVLGRAGLWAGLAMFGAMMFYLRLSRPLAFGMLIVFVVLGLITEALYRALGAQSLMWLGMATFVLAWIVQLIGHTTEGKKPSLRSVRAYLLVGPAWLMAKLMNRLGLAY